MTKLWLASDAEGVCGLNGLHLFTGNEPPSFEQGGSRINDNCEYLGEVSAASIRGTLPEPGTCVEAILLTKGPD